MNDPNYLNEASKVTFEEAQARQKDLHGEGGRSNIEFYKAILTIAAGILVLRVLIEIL